MSTEATLDDGTFEECVDDLDDFLVTQEHYPRTVLAFALLTHLASLMRALLEHGECTRQEVTKFLGELEEEVLRNEGS